MRIRALILSGLAFVAVHAACAQAPTINVINRARRATFKITTYDANGRAIATGTGFFVTADGWVYTCLHVIEDAYSVQLHLGPQRQVHRRLLRFMANDGYDAAAFKVPGLRGVPFLNLSEKVPEDGAPLFAISAPKGRDDFYAYGKHLGKVFDSNRRMGLALSSTLGTQGSSGGPVMNTSGEVIGMIASEDVYANGEKAVRGRMYAIPMKILEDARKRTKQRQRRRR